MRRSEQLLSKIRLRDVLRTKPRPFQRRGIRFLCETEGRALLADDMGLGKTLQALGWLALNPRARPAIVVCPANCKFNWRAEIKEHTYMKCEVLEGKKPYLITRDIAIINYEIIGQWKDQIARMAPRALILDECHYVKNRQTKRTKACRQLARRCRYVLPMSGTPIVNRPLEFFPVLNMIRPREFDSFWKYVMRYCKPKHRFGGWDFTGASHTDELHDRVSEFMIRRTKEEVLPELPQKQRSKLIVDIDNRGEYNRAQEDFLNWYESLRGSEAREKAAKAETMVRVGQLKRLAALGKFHAAEQWVKDFLETTGEKLVIFCHHKSVFQLLYQAFHKIAAVGGKAGIRRQHEIERFQKDRKCKIYLGSLKADGQGITLTAASTVLFLELGWTPGEHVQAEDRVYRIGQKANHVDIYYMLARHTIDRYVWETIKGKKQVLGEIIDGQPSSLSTPLDKIIRALRKGGRDGNQSD